jgi:hypothetical protein
MTSKRPEPSGLPCTFRVNRGPVLCCMIVGEDTFILYVQSVKTRLQGASSISFHSSHELPPSTPPQEGIDGNELINALT